MTGGWGGLFPGQFSGQTGGGWRELSGAKKQTYTYPWLSIDPASGRVFMAGPQATRYLSTVDAGKISAGPARKTSSRRRISSTTTTVM